MITITDKKTDCRFKISLKITEKQLRYAIYQNVGSIFLLCELIISLSLFNKKKLNTNILANKEKKFLTKLNKIK